MTPTATHTPLSNPPAPTGRITEPEASEVDISRLPIVQIAENGAIDVGGSDRPVARRRRGSGGRLPTRADGWLPPVARVDSLMWVPVPDYSRSEARAERRTLPASSRTGSDVSSHERGCL
jgi:hypothetical protein